MSLLILFVSSTAFSVGVKRSPLPDICDVSLEDLPQTKIITEAVTTGFARRGGKGFAVVSLLDAVSKGNRDKWSVHMNKLFDRTPKVRESDTPFDQISLGFRTRNSGKKKDYNHYYNSYSMTLGYVDRLSSAARIARWKELRPVVKTMLPWLVGFLNGLPPDERPYVRLGAIDLRRYYDHGEEDKNPHADGMAYALTLSPNDLGTIMESSGATQAWDLVILSNKERNLRYKSVVPTLHRSPESQPGRLFVRVSFVFVSSPGDPLKILIADVNSFATGQLH